MAKNTGNHNGINFSRIRKVRDIIKVIEDDGWVFDRQKGSHRHYKHVIKPCVVTVAGHLGHDLRRGNS